MAASDAERLKQWRKRRDKGQRHIGFWTGVKWGSQLAELGWVTKAERLDDIALTDAIQRICLQVIRTGLRPEKPTQNGE